MSLLVLSPIPLLTKHNIPQDFYTSYPDTTYLIHLKRWASLYLTDSWYWNQIMIWLDENPYPRTVTLLNLSGQHLPVERRLIISPPFPIHCIHVDLSYNRLVDLNPLNSHIFQTLNIQCNQLISLPNHICTSLKILNASYNLFTTLPECFIQSKSLQEVDLTHNKLQRVPLFMNETVKIKYQFNPIYEHHKDVLGIDPLKETWTLVELATIHQSLKKPEEDQETPNTPLDPLGRFIDHFNTTIQVLQEERNDLYQKYTSLTIKVTQLEEDLQESRKSSDPFPCYTRKRKLSDHYLSPMCNTQTPPLLLPLSPLLSVCSN
jgi:Leucine-rich repeat (LRR) protein